MNSSKHTVLLARHKIFFYVTVLVFSIILPPPYSSSSGVIWGERNEPLNARVLGISLFLNSFLLCFLFSEITNSKGNHHGDFYLDSIQPTPNQYLKMSCTSLWQRASLKYQKSCVQEDIRKELSHLKLSCFPNPLLPFDVMHFVGVPTSD